MTSKNWAGNLTYRATSLVEPTSLDELRDVIGAQRSVTALGSRHSFNDIADTEHTQVSVRRMPAEMTIDASARTVTVNAGARYGEFVESLDAAGWALHNLASLPHISVAGAIATGTHGSGDGNGSLASAVAAMDFVLADGSLLSVRRGETDFKAMVVALGALGVAHRVTLDISPAFEIRQSIWERLSWSSLADDFEAITSSAYSVSLFTDWGDDGITQAWLKSTADDPRALERDEFFGATPASTPLHPLPDVDPQFTTDQLGVAGRWWNRLPHFKLEFTPSNGEEMQSEYLVPRSHALAAIDAVRQLAPRIRPHLFVSEIRTIARDDLWLSPSHGVDCVALHFTWQPHIAEVDALLPHLDAALAPFEARPHWGKLFATDRDRLSEVYPRLRAFDALASTLDPEGKFRNDFLDRWIFSR
ncbi:FAD-binding protein [Marisediminicola sp. LYQ134]|uniref:FAD-binding protein n=1 Tax=Marisediminicola sp. LYQ134 TaxID=3391061 RepID=UPI00398395D8